MPPTSRDDFPPPSGDPTAAFDALPPGPAPVGCGSETATLAPSSPAAEPATLATTATPVAPERVAIPGYEILSELGRGGMGVVYKARQVKLGRLVALKMILSGGHAGENDLARFRTEAEAIARLQHPNIVQIHEIGEQDDRPFFSLEFCAGGSLEQKLAGTPLPPKEAARLVETLARAMQAAHEAGVAHRDLKPANVLLTTDGTPKITDFGLAKKLDAAGQTASGAVMGTPSYMAPEQAGGKSMDIGPRADVYALGAILYCMLTGRPPFRAATALDTILQVVSDEPVPPTQLQPKTPRDLETICLKCLQKEPAKRYLSAAALAEDVRRFQNGEPILARPVGRVERTWRWCRRNPMVAALMLLLLLGACVATGLAVWALTEKARADSKALLATQEAERAEKQLARAEMSAYVNRITLAQAEWEHGSAALAWEHLNACQWNLRGWEHDNLATRFNMIPTFKGHKNWVRSVAFSPDGKRIVSGSYDIFGSVDYTVKVWDVATGSETFSLKGHTGPVNSVAFSPDGQRIVSGSNDRTVKVWDADKGTELLSLKEHKATVASVAFSPDGKRIVSGSYDGTVKVWDADKGTDLLSLKTGSVDSVAFSPDGKRIVGCQSGTVKVWDADKGTETLSLKGHPGCNFTSVAFSRDGKRIVSGSGGGLDANLKSLPGQISVWDADKGTEMLSLKAHTDIVSSVAFSPDGKRIVSGSFDQTAKVWDIDKGTETLSLKGHTDIVFSVAFSPDGKRIVGSKAMTVKVWDADKGSETLSLKGHAHPVYCMAFSPDGKRIVSGSIDPPKLDKPGEVKVWNADTGTETLGLKGLTGGVTSVAFSPDGKRILSASGNTNRMVKVWDADKGTEMLSIKDAAGPVAFSPDGKRILSGMVIRDADTGTELLTLKAHDAHVIGLGVSSVAFSPDGKRIVSGSEDYTVRVWDADNGTETLCLTRHKGRVKSVAFSPDGKRIVSGSVDGTIKVWDAGTGIETLTLMRHPGYSVTSVAFSPDGKRILSATGGTNGRVKVWDADKGMKPSRGREQRSDR